MAIGDTLEGDLLRGSAFHAHTLTPPKRTRVRIEASGASPADLYLIAYKKSGSSWVRIASNDDCDATTLNACLTLDVVAVAHRVVVTTYQAMTSKQQPDVNYSLLVTCAASDGCGISQACGSRGLAPCGQGYCAFPVEAMCGATDRPGTCTLRPVVCNRLYDPVCGCDGKTYGNACSAAAAGVSVASQGERAAAPVCDNVGTRSEGWYDAKTGALIAMPRVAVRSQPATRSGRGPRGGTPTLAVAAAVSRGSRGPAAHADAGLRRFCGTDV